MGAVWHLDGDHPAGRTSTEAKRAATEEHDLQLALNHPLLTVKSRQHLSMLAAVEGRTEDAVALANEALRLARTLSDRDEPGW